MKKGSCALLVVFCASQAHAGWEISLLAGWTAPTFEERVVFRPDIDLPEIPGGRLRQEGELALHARGSSAFGGGVAYFFNEHVGVEARVDTIDFEIDSLGPRFVADFEVLPPPFPPATATLDVGAGVIDVERLYPISFNLKARTGGVARFVASGGVSYLPRVRFDAAQPVSLRLTLPGLPETELASVVLGAAALAENEEARWGFNGGVGIEIQVAPGVSLVGDLRAHAFDPQTFAWQRSEAPSSELDAIVLEELETLPPIEIELIYFQATGGVSFRF